MSTNGKTLNFRAAKLKGFTVYFLLPARNYKAQSGLAIKIEIYIG